MEELSGKVQKASTHIGSVGVDIAVVERDCATVDADATSVLPNNKHVSNSEHPIGAMGWAWSRVWWRLAERTEDAVFE